MTTGSRAASKHILQSNWALGLGLMHTDSSPEDESVVGRGEVSRAEVSAGRSGRIVLTSRGALRARRIGTEGECPRPVICSDCCAFID